MDANIQKEVDRLKAAADLVSKGQVADATIKLQAVLANWKLNHPGYPVSPKADYDITVDTRPPTAKQLEYAVRVARYTGIRLPEKTIRSEYSRWLDENASRYMALMADARDQGEDPWPVWTEEETLAQVKGGIPKSCNVSGSQGCKSCQEHQRQYTEKHKNDHKPDSRGLEPF